MRPSAALVAVGCALLLLLLHAGPAPAAEGPSRDVLESRQMSPQLYMPAPKVEPGAPPRPCALASMPRVAAGAPPLGNAEKNALFFWGKLHFRFEGSCTDWDFVTRQWQQTLGTPLTGLLTSAEMAAVLAPNVARTRVTTPETQAQAQARLDYSLPQSEVDFLPPGSSIVDNGCSALAARAAPLIRAETARRIAALPPGSVRSAVTERIESEVKAQLLTVAPEWQALWARAPLLDDWAALHGCNAPLRIKVEYWQVSMGGLANAHDPQLVADAEQKLAAAAAATRQFQLDQVRFLQAEAAANGEFARTRTWSLSDVGGSLQLAQALDLMPTAFCSAQAGAIACRRVTPCAAEIQQAEAARVRAGSTLAMRKPTDLSLPPETSVFRDARDADLAARRCKLKMPYTAAANSRLGFAGQELQTAELTFGPRGLVFMKLLLRSEQAAEPARALLVERFGQPRPEQETRSRLVMRQVQTWVQNPQGSGFVQAVSNVPTEQPYAVTRYTWNHPTALVEESTGTITVRFSPR